MRNARGKTMKKITKTQSTQLTAGTEITTYDGDTILILTNYIPNSNGYEYAQIDYDEGGNTYQTHTGFITARETTHYYL